MRIQRHVVVFDASDLDIESAFWGTLLGGRVVADDTFHCVLDSAGRWRIGVQLAPDHVAPGWPDGNPQQVHIDLHVDDPVAAHTEALGLGARLLMAADDLTADEGHQVDADPAGHPFCLGWGHPTDEAIRSLFDTLPHRDRPEPPGPRRRTTWPRPLSRSSRSTPSRLANG